MIFAMTSADSRRKKRNLGFTAGQLNAIVDAFCEPFEGDPKFLLLDSLLHMLIEGDDLPTSLAKFARFNLPKFVNLISEASVKREDQPPSLSLEKFSAAKMKRRKLEKNVPKD